MVHYNPWFRTGAGEWQAQRPDPTESCSHPHTRCHAPGTMDFCEAKFKRKRSQSDKPEAISPYSFCPQHFLYFLPLPHGHASFLPIFSSFTTGFFTPGSAFVLIGSATCSLFGALETLTL